MCACRKGIIPLDVTSDVGGPIGRTVEDVARVFQLLVGFDPEDTLTSLAKENPPVNYSASLVPGLSVCLFPFCINHRSVESSPTNSSTALFRSDCLLLQDLQMTGRNFIGTCPQSMQVCAFCLRARERLYPGKDARERDRARFQTALECVTNSDPQAAGHTELCTECRLQPATQ